MLKYLEYVLSLIDDLYSSSHIASYLALILGCQSLLIQRTHMKQISTKRLPTYEPINDISFHFAMTSRLIKFTKLIKFSRMLKYPDQIADNDS